MELSATRWIELLSQAHVPSPETVVYIAPLRNPLRIRKEAWLQHWKGWGGIDLQAGAEIELVARNEGGARVFLPDWAIEQLQAHSGDQLCVTRRDGSYYLKRLDLVQVESALPGRTILDSFADRAVTRTYTNQPRLDEIELPKLREWLGQMGRLHSDPRVPFQALDGRLGLLARKAFLGGWSEADCEQARALAGQLSETQAANGSWEDDVLLTAANLIRLRQLEVSADEPARVQAVEWLLALPEPVGLPGLWLVSPALTKRFNAWKSKPGVKGRPHRRESRGERSRFVEHVGYTINYAVDACELRLTWTTALVLEALLRCGQHTAPRVVTAINTLLDLCGSGGWCGCGYLDAKVSVAASSEPTDLNRIPVPNQNVPHSIDWYAQSRDTTSPTFDGHIFAVQAGGRQALLVKSWHNTGLCSMVVHRALSHHPGYAGSSLEVAGALLLAYVQSAAGTWGEMVNLSTMLGFLARSTHPLAAFLVLRSVPLLIRIQRSDGLWREPGLSYLDESTPAPSSAESTFLILSALKQFEFLDALLPS